MSDGAGTLCDAAHKFACLRFFNMCEKLDTRCPQINVPRRGWSVLSNVYLTNIACVFGQESNLRP